MFFFCLLPTFSNENKRNISMLLVAGWLAALRSMCHRFGFFGNTLICVNNLVNRRNSKSQQNNKTYLGSYRMKLHLVVEFCTVRAVYLLNRLAIVTIGFGWKFPKAKIKGTWNAPRYKDQEYITLLLEPVAC